MSPAGPGLRRLAPLPVRGPFPGGSDASNGRPARAERAPFCARRNADDNRYETGALPTLRLVQQRRALTLYNNEAGFRAEHVLSLIHI